MNFERMKAAVKNRELLGLEPFYLLKNILERQQVNGWGNSHIVLRRRMFDSSNSLQMISYPVDKYSKNPFFNLLNVNNPIQTIN